MTQKVLHQGKPITQKIFDEFKYREKNGMKNKNNNSVLE